MNSISKIHTQLLLRIRKANFAALTPSQRVQLNLCISQANHLEGVPSMPLIENAPKLHRNASTSLHLSAANLVRDCQNALSLAAPLLPSSIAATPVGSSGAPSSTIESPPLKRVKTHKSLSEYSEERRQGGQKGHSQEMPPLRKPKNDPATRVGATTNTEGIYIHAADSEAERCLATAVFGDAIRSSEPMQTKASSQMLSPSASQFPSMTSTSPPHSSRSRRRSPSRSIQKPAAVQQAAYHRSAGFSISMSAASSPSVPTARCPSDDIGFSTQALLDPSLLPPYYQSKQSFPCDSAALIYNTIHPNPTPAAIPSSLIGNEDNRISGNDNIFNGYDEQAFFSQYLNIEGYIGDQELHTPQLFSESEGSMGSSMGQLQSTTSPIHGQQMVESSQWHFQEIPQQGGIHMSYMSLTGNQLIPPYQFQQQVQWAQENFQACPPGSEGDSDQNPIALG